MFLPKRINVRRKAAWFDAKGEPDDMSPADAQVGCSSPACCTCLLLQAAGLQMSAIQEANIKRQGCCWTDCTISCCAWQMPWWP